jgi:VWFA-related protein
MKFPSMPKLPPGTFTNYTPEPVNGAVDILLIDSLNTPLTDQLYVRQQLLAYIKAMPPGSRIAIFGLTSHLSILEGFTSDPDVLKSVALSSKLTRNSPVLKDSTGGSGTQNSPADDAEDSGLPADTVANMRIFEAEIESFQTQLRIKFTLDAMSQLARYLAGIPGRKNLIWFSGSFPISIFPDPNLPGPFSPWTVAADSEDQFRYTVNQLARAQVAVYPIDARGLTSTSAFDAASSRNYAGGNPARMTQDLNKFSNDTALEHSTMSQMAEATGGHAYYNGNNLTKAVATAVEEGSNFYSLAYTSANSNRHGEFRKINIRLAQQGFTLNYRRGYYADNPDNINSSGKASPSKQVPDGAVTAAAPSVRQSIRGAMMRGSPTPSEILIKVGVFPTGPAAQTHDQPAPGNILSEKTHGPYRNYTVSYAISPNDITFIRKPDGKIHANFELVVFVYNPDGTLVNRLSTPLSIASTMDEIVKSVAQGIHYTQEVSVPVKGEYFLRIAVHDLQRDRFGVVEVATSDVKNLMLPTAAPPPPSTATTPASAPASSAPK